MRSRRRSASTFRSESTSLQLEVVPRAADPARTIAEAMQAVMTMTPSAAARTGANYDESALVPRRAPVTLCLACQLECELADRAEMHGQVVVQVVALEQLLRHPDDRRGRRAKAEVATVTIGHDTVMHTHSPAAMGPADHFSCTCGLCERVRERLVSSLEHRLAVRHEHEVDVEVEQLAQTLLQARAGPVLLLLREPRQRHAHAARVADEHVADDERPPRLEEEHRLDPVGTLDDLRAHPRRQLPRLIGAPQPSVVPLEHGLDAALVPVHRLQDVDGARQPLDVTVEGVPEALRVVDGHLRIDDRDGVRKLRVDGTDDLRPAKTVLPFGMCGLPAPEARPQLLDVHDENLIQRRRSPLDVISDWRCGRPSPRELGL